MAERWVCLHAGGCAECAVCVQKEHLQHWGINMMTAEKTQATTTELQIKLNMSYEFDQITESGQALQPMSGPGCACGCSTATQHGHVCNDHNIYL